MASATATLPSSYSLHLLSSPSPPSSSNTHCFLPQSPLSKPKLPSLSCFSFTAQHGYQTNCNHTSLILHPFFLLSGLDTPLDTQTALSTISVIAAIALSLFLGLKVNSITLLSFSVFRHLVIMIA